MVEKQVDRTTDLAERALCLGYTEQAAFTMADCWANWNLVSDPCLTHPMHSTTMRDGYRVEGCEACHVIMRTDAEGYYPGKWAAILADREAEYVKIMESHIAESYTLGQCACDLIIEMGAKRLPIGGRCCQGCGSIFTAEGDTPNGSVVAESNRITTPAASTLTLETSLCDDGKCGTCPDCVECAAIVEPAPGFDEAMAEAERDDAKSGIDTLRELLTLTPVRTPKVATVHLGAFGSLTACGRTVTESTTFQADTNGITCKRCQATRRFSNMAHQQVRKAAQDVWARAGLVAGMVVRQITTGRLGRIGELSDTIRVGYWTGEPRSVYARLADFDSACQIVTAYDLVKVGDRIVSNLGGEATVEEIGSLGIWTIMDGETGAQVRTVSEFAAEVSRGWLAVVPTRTCPACRERLSNPQGHEHFGRQVEFYGWC